MSFNDHEIKFEAYLARGELFLASSIISLPYGYSSQVIGVYMWKNFVSFDLSNTNKIPVYIQKKKKKYASVNQCYC